MPSPGLGVRPRGNVASHRVQSDRVGLGLDASSWTRRTAVAVGQQRGHSTLRLPFRGSIQARSGWRVGRSTARRRPRP